MVEPERVVIAPITGSLARIAIWIGLGALLWIAGPERKSARAQFTTVIDSPPATSVYSIRQSNTQVNIWDGGNIESNSRFGDLNTTNIEANIYGGTIGSSIRLFDGSTLNIFAGTVGASLNSYDQSVVNLFGGRVRQGFVANTGSVIHASGGSIDGLTAKSGSVVNITAGTHGSIQADSGSIVDISGGTIGNRLSLYGAGHISGGIIGNEARFSSTTGVQITGGSIGNLFVGSGKLDMSGGEIGSSGAFNGGTFNVTGGTIGSYFNANAGSEINISGGSFGFGFYSEPGGSIQMSGGVMGDYFQISPGSTATISGGVYRLDGVAIAELNEIGASRQFDLPAGSTLTGVLADGTPFAYTSLDGDRLPEGTLTLKTVETPAIEPASIDARYDPLPLGIRQGQTVFVPAGATLPDQFMAGEGSSVVISGGNVGPSFEAIGGHVSISGGDVGFGFDAFHGSVVDLSGGFIREEMQAFAGSVVNISGGAVRQRFQAYAGSNVNLTGGSVADRFEALAGSEVTIAGGEFRLDGELISGLDTAGATLPLDIPIGSVLSGTLADGTPFAFSSVNRDNIAGGTVTLRNSPLPTADPTVFHVPGDPVPAGIRAGQSIIVSEGGVIPAQFSAGWGSSVTITGGAVGDNFEAVGAEATISGGVVEDFTAWNSTVELSGGTIGVAWDSALRVSSNSILNISGGTFKNGSASDHSVVNISGGTGSMRADSESVVNITGGVVGINARDASTVNIHGGRVGLNVEHSIANVYGGDLGYETSVASGGTINFFGGMAALDFDVRAGGTANVLGGNIARGLSASEGSQLNISGGAIGDSFVAKEGSDVRLIGHDFRIDGVLVDGLDAIGNTATVRVPYGSWITGTLADGTPFAFSDEESDSITEATLVLESRPIAAGPAVIHVPTDTAPLGVHAGQTLILGDGGRLANNFSAGRGSSVVVNAGAVGNNFEAAGANVSITGGNVGPEFDAIGNSVVTISGGTVGDSFEVFDSVVNISGGSFGPYLSVHEGSEINISGGIVAPTMRTYAGCTVNVSAGDVGGILAEGGRINISGGTLAGMNAREDTVVNIAGGNVGSIGAYEGSNFEISGGRFVGGFSFSYGSTGSISGGSFDSYLKVDEGAELTVAGGSIASQFTIRGAANIAGGTFAEDPDATYSSQVTLVGNDFRINGTLVSGLENIGDSVVVNGIAGSLTGTLADGSPFAFTGDYYNGRFLGSVTLKAAALPAVAPGEINVPSDTAPRGIRGGQTLTVRDGGAAPNHFTAGHGSTVIVTGGQVGRGFRAAGAHVTVSAGAIGEEFRALHGSTVEISGGSFGEYARAYGSNLTITGGEFTGGISLREESSADVAGGEFDDLHAGSDSIANISGGEFSSMAVDSGGQLNISGGALRGKLQVYTRSTLTLIGNDFHLDGVPIPGLETIGNSVQVTKRSSILSGTLSDGTPFSLDASDGYQYSDGTVILRASAIASGPQFIQLPQDPLPLGIARGQTLVVGEGAVLPRGYDAGEGSTLRVEGGSVQSDLDAVGATVVITDGVVGEGFDALYGTVIHMSGGEIGSNLKAGSGSRVNINGGIVGENFVTRENSLVNISGGEIGRGFYAGNLSTVFISGGSIASLSSHSGSSVTISGGTFGDGLAPYNQTLQIVGGEFRVNGQLVDTSEWITDTDRIGFGPNEVFSGTLADGTPFAFSEADGDRLASTWYGYSSVEVKLVALPPTGPAYIDAATDLVPAGIRAGQSMAVHNSAVVPNFFNAGFGSRVEMTGGQIGDNFEAVGAEIDITDGVIGDEFDAFAGTIVNIHGGTLGQHFSVHNGAVANIHGGTFGSQLELLTGGQIHLFGDHFLLEGNPIEGLVRGQPFELTQRNVTLSGTLADGSVFSFNLAPSPNYESDHFAANARLTLSIVPIPEPATGTILLMGIFGCCKFRLRRRIAARCRNDARRAHR